MDDPPSQETVQSGATAVASGEEPSAQPLPLQAPGKLAPSTAATAEAEAIASSNSSYSSSPAFSVLSSSSSSLVPTDPGLARTDSTPSSDAVSLKSHVSVPVTGTFPLGSLRVHKIMDSPRPRPVEPTSVPAPPPQQRQLLVEDGKEGLNAAASAGVIVGDDDNDEEHENMPPLENDEDSSHHGTAVTGVLGTTGQANHTNTAITGDVFLILDLPANSTVGCDAKAIGTGSANSATATAGGGPGGGFQGIRDIPPGTHFIWVSEPNAMSRCGYWLVTAPEKGQQVRVKQWDKFNEVLVDPASQFEVRDLRKNVASLYPQLVPYGFGAAAAAAVGGGGGGKDGAATATAAQPTVSNTPGGALPRANLDEAQLWERLTCCITEKVLSRVTGKTGPVSEWLVDTSDTAAGETGPTTNSHKAVYQTLVGSTGELNFLFPEGDIDLHEYISTTDRNGNINTTTTTSNSLQGGGRGGGPIAPPDTSLDILRLVDTPGTGVTGQDLVGELQLTFVTGLHLSNLSCVDQWWHLVLKVFLRAHELLVRRPSLSLLFLRTLHAQVVYNEEYIGGGADDSSPSNLHRVGKEEDIVVDVRHEYGRGGAGATGSSGGGGGFGNNQNNNINTTSLLDIVPGNKRKLRAALTLYKRRMNEILLDFAPGDAQRGAVTPEQGAVGQVFAELEAWFWRWGWDLRTDHVDGRGNSSKKAKEEDGEEEEEEGYGYDDDDEYKPVVVDLDEDGREVGMVSFDS